MNPRDRARIASVVLHAQRALEFIQRPDVEVCRHTAYPGPLDYTRPELTPDQRRLFPQAVTAPGLVAIDKQIGSDLTGLASAIQELRKMLAPADGV